MDNERSAKVPVDVLHELEKMLNTKYAVFLKDRQFYVISDHLESKDVASVRVLLADDDENFYYPVEGYLEFADQDMDRAQATLFLIDYIDLYFEDFFDQDEELYIPIQWAKYDYDAVDFYLKGQVLNRNLERRADKLLESTQLS